MRVSPARDSLRSPDFEQLRIALTCGQPRYVPALELFHDIDVKEAYLGRPIQTLADDIEFHRAAGYDHYAIWMKHPVFNMRDHPLRGSTVTSDAYGGEGARTWVAEHAGLINDMDDFEAFPWPNPRNAEFVVGSRHTEVLPLDAGVDKITDLLPDGMGLILCADGIFERFSKGIMGYANFCYKLYDDPDLVERIFHVVGELWLSMFARAAAHPQVRLANERNR